VSSFKIVFFELEFFKAFSPSNSPIAVDVGIIPGDFLKFSTCYKWKGLFLEADLVGSLVDASRERAHFRSAIHELLQAPLYSRALGKFFETSNMRKFAQESTSL
jgi:hypothetical protein